MTEHTTWGLWPMTENFWQNDRDSHEPPSKSDIRRGPTVDDGSKKHAACDECRKRKLRCSGEASGCSKCLKQGLNCHYSKQKTMGRPRKRRDDSNVEANHVPHGHGNPSSNSQDSSIIPRGGGQSVDGQQNAFQPTWQSNDVQVENSIHPQSTIPDGILYGSHGASNRSSGSDITAPRETPPTPFMFYPTSMAQWPGVSTVTQLPQRVADNHPTEIDPSLMSSEPLYTLPSAPTCPCLPSLYLTLSTLAVMANFPVSRHSVETMMTASRTAQTVIYCSVCPLEFQSGIQNIMLVATLLNVLADNWNRIRRAPAEDLRNGFESPLSASIPLTPHDRLKWKLLAHYLTRAHVFGDARSPTTFTLPDGTQSESYCPYGFPKGAPITLMYLVNTLERRQKTWHGKIVDTGEFAKKVENAPLLMDMGHAGPGNVPESELHKDGFLCLKVADAARAAVMALDKPPPTWRDVGLEDSHGDNCASCMQILGQVQGG